MRIFRNPLSLLLASVVCLIRCANAATDDSPLTIDPAFSNGFAPLKQATGFIEQPADSAQADWKPNLQLWVGVKAVEGAKQTIYFVQLTTLPPPLTNADGKAWQPVLRTNDWAWSPSNKTKFVSAGYPVRVRVFDGTGHQLKEGQTPMAWGMLTNGLMDLCRLSLETYGNQTNAPLTVSNAGQAVEKSGAKTKGKKPAAPAPQLSDELMRATGGGFLWMFGMLYDLQTVPAVANVWAKAQCAIRWPSAWSLATSLVKGLTLMLLPRLEEVSLVSAAPGGHDGPLYRLPVDLNCDKRNLSRVEIIIGQAHGAEMLLAGIRSVHAVHPTKPKQEFLAQVLAAGTGGEEK
jgi:hypothetical protein